MRSFAIRTRVEPSLFYSFDSTNSAISEKSAAMLPSSPNLPHGHLKGNEALRDYFLRFGGGTPVAILAYLDDFLAAGQDRSAVTLWAQQTRLVFDAMGFSFKERKF